MFKKILIILIILIFFGTLGYFSQPKIDQYGATLVYPSRGGTGLDTSSYGTSSSEVCMSITDGVWGTTTCSGAAETDPVWSASTSEYLTITLIETNYYSTTTIDASSTIWATDNDSWVASGSEYYTIPIIDASNSAWLADNDSWPASSSEYLTLVLLQSNYYGTNTVDASNSAWEQDTTYTAGDYLTLTGTDFDLDQEIVSTTININYQLASTSDPWRDVYVLSDYARTLTFIRCRTNAGTSSITVGECLPTSGATTSEMLHTLVCDNDSATSTFTDSSLAARNQILVRITGVNGATSTYVSISSYPTD